MWVQQGKCSRLTQRLPQWINVDETISALLNQPVTTESSPLFVALHLTGDSNPIRPSGGFLSYLWGFQNGKWLPTDTRIPLGDNYIRLSDSATGYWTDISMLLVEGYLGAVDPLLARIGTGAVVKKGLGLSVAMLQANRA